MVRRRALECALIFGILTAVPAAAHSALLQDAPPPSENSLVHPTPHQTDATVEPPPAIEPIASIALSAAAIACAAWIIRRRLFDPVPLGPSREWPLGGIADWPVVLLGGMVAWVAQSAGASSAVMLFSLDGVARDTLRGGALVSLGGYLGAAVGIFFTLAVLPNMAGIIRLRSNRAPSLPGDIGAAPESAMRLILRAAAGFLLVFPIVMTVGWVSSIAARRLTGETLDPLAHKTLRLLSDADTSADGGVWWWATVLCVLLGAPIVEEIVYRGFIQSAIRRAVLWSAETRPRDPLRPPPRRRAAWASILGTSILFASMHLGVVESHALVTLFALSIGFGIACERSGRLATPIVMHVLFNAANLGLSIVA